jgi:GTP-binding protein YchF
MKIGIVGLPNVGKSTLFKALTKKEVPRENYPFCTIEPNVGIVPVPDERLKALAQTVHSTQTTPTTIEFVDIAGLVRGAHQGEGLGNKFLSHIKEVDAICEVVRAFTDENIHHVERKIDPLADIETVNLELIMSDLQLLLKRIDEDKGAVRAGDKEGLKKLEVYQKIKDILDQGKLAQEVILNQEELALIRDLNLLTLKPFLYVFNIKKDQPILIEEQKMPIPYLILDIQLESELVDLEENETEEYLKELDLENTGLDKLIQLSYKTLDLITFFTAGEKETRGWTIKKGALAPGAAGQVHSDMEQGFIRAEIINWVDLVKAGGWVEAKNQGLIRLEGKEYEVKDGDVCFFRFSI